MVSRLKTILFLFLFFSLVGCGTTSALIPAYENSISESFNGYEKIIITDFVDATHKNKSKAQSMRRKKAMGIAIQRFADMLAMQIEKTGAFDQVVRQVDDQIIEEGEHLLVRGEITRYSKGNTFLRVVIGYGVGTAFLDAEITLYDAYSNEQIGHLYVDRNSWVLGGVLAITHNVNYFMDKAADKIANEIAIMNNKDSDSVLAKAPVEQLSDSPSP